MVWAGDGELVLWTNRGLMRGMPGGEFRLLCNAALSVPSSEQVDFILAADGGLLMATSSGLLRSTDGACSFSPLAPFGDDAIYAMRRRPDASAEILLVTAGATRAVYGSSDEGASWQMRAAIASDEYYENLRFAPSQPDTVYADGLAVGTPFTHFVAVSSDGGDSWERRDLPLLDTESDATLLAVAPLDPKRLLVKAHDNGPDLMDRLLLSTDGGQTFTAVLRTKHLQGAGFSGDGGRIYAAGQDGLFWSEDGGQSFDQHPDAERMTCVFERDGALYACGFYAGFLAGLDGLARSSDGGATFQPVMRFSDVQSAVDCHSETPTAIACEMLWGDWQREFGTDASGTPDAGGVGMVPIPSPAASDAGTVVGPAPGPSPSGPAPAMPAGADTAAGEGDGCGCAMVGRSRSRTGLACVLPLLLAWLGRRHRRARR